MSRAVPALALLASLFLFPSVEGSIRTLLRADATLVTGGYARALSELGVERGGEPELPDTVRPAQAAAMIALLRANSVTSYRLSPGISANWRVLQRVAEGAWPIRLELGAGWLFLTRAELGTDAGRGCQPVMEREGAVLARCP